ncbi:ROK family protein [Nonomuraea sp. NPDC050404]|uniref:ROK family protein n=1 Tax=Nonomuraea sp. NPDC050404 TaxID=3155783 RepID=UPI0033E0E38A
MTLTGQDPALLRRLNTTAVLRALHGVEGATLTELVKITSISRATIEDVIASQPDLVEEIAPKPGDPRPVGRPAKRLRFRAEAGHVVGLDIGPHKVLALTADLKGTIIDTRRSLVDPRAEPAARLAAARSVVRRSLRAAGVGPGGVRALGVATTGVVDPVAGKVVVSDRLPGWAGLDLAGSLTGLSVGPVLVGNDTNLAALAEHWAGAARDAQDVLCLLVGRSIAAGLLIGGKLYAGRNGAAGEIGVMRAFGWYTALDRFLAYGDDDPAGGSSSRDAAERVFEAVRRGDPQAAAIVRAFARDLAKGVGAAVLTMDPELVVLGGGLSGAGELLTGPLREELAEFCLFPVRVEASTLGGRSVALGAVRLALDHVEHELFDV